MTALEREAIQLLVRAAQALGRLGKETKDKDNYREAVTVVQLIKDYLGAVARSLDE
jgi:hypothetical protein